MVTLDLEPFRAVNLVGKADRMPIRNDCLDLVIITAVLEHVKEPPAVVAEINRILKNPGTVYVEHPFLQPFHADPDDYQRYTLMGLRHLFRDFQIIDSGVCVGPFSSLAFFVRKFCTVFVVNAYIAKGVEFVVGWLTFWIKYFDWLLVRAKRLHIASGGLYLLLRK